MAQGSNIVGAIGTVFRVNSMSVSLTSIYEVLDRRLFYGKTDSLMLEKEDKR